MFDFKKLRDWLPGTSKMRTTLLTIAGIFVIIALFEVGLNWWIRTLLRHQFIKEGGPGFRLEAKMGWMNMFDLAKGKVKRIWLESSDCIISDLRYRYLLVDNEGLDFDLPLLVEGKRLRLEGINRTRLRGIVTERALSEHLNLKYPEFQPEVNIVPGQIQISGVAELFRTSTKVQVGGRLESSGPKTVRFYTESLFVAGRKVPRDLLRLISTQIPLTFTVMEEWPLKISGLDLKAGELEIRLGEMTE